MLLDMSAKSRILAHPKIPTGPGLIIGTQFQSKGTSSEEILTNVVYIFLLLTFGGITLACISFGLREYLLSIKNINSGTSARIKEDEWDLQESGNKSIPSPEPVPLTNSAATKNATTATSSKSGNLVHYPLTQIVSLTVDEVNNLKSGYLKNCGDGIFTHITAENSGESSGDIIGKLRVVKENNSPDFSNISLLSGRANRQSYRTRYEFSEFFEIRKKVHKVGNILPVLIIERLDDINHFVNLCGSFVLNRKERTATRIIYIMKILTLSRKPGSSYISTVGKFNHYFISKSYMNDFNEKGSIYLQSLLISSVIQFLVDQWNYKLDIVKIKTEFDKWNSIPHFANKIENFDLICRFITSVCNLKPIKVRSKFEIKLVTLLRKTIFKIDCEDYDNIVFKQISYTIDKLQSKRLKLEFYDAVIGLVKSHYDCCIGHDVMENQELKAIFQNGLFNKQDTKLKARSRELGKILVSHNKLVQKWFDEVNDGDVYASVIAKQITGEVKNIPENKVSTHTYRARPITPGAWRLEN